MRLLTIALLALALCGCVPSTPGCESLNALQCHELLMERERTRQAMAMALYREEAAGLRAELRTWKEAYGPSPKAGEGK